AAVPRAHRARARDPGPRGAGAVERRDHGPARAVAEEDPEPRIQRVRQAPGARPGRGDRARPRGGTRGLSRPDRAPVIRGGDRDSDRDTGPMTTGLERRDASSSRGARTLDRGTGGAAWLAR